MFASKFAAKFAALAVIGLSLAACAGSLDGMGPGPKENTGTLLGAGTGALLGAAVAAGGTGNRLAGAAVGGLLGGLIGNRIGAGRNCRSFSHTIYIDGRPQTARGTACRNPDGTWTSLG